MAEVVTVNGVEVKKRHSWGIWLLAFVTLGIYSFVWYYKINDEARRALKDESIKPVVALLAVLLGGILLYIPTLVSVYRTGERVGRIEEMTKGERSTSAALGLLAFLFIVLHMPYLQGKLNGSWDAAATGPLSPPVA